MDSLSLQWKSKSPEKIPGETESSGSDMLRPLPNHAQSPEVSSKNATCEDAQSPEVLSKDATCEDAQSPHISSKDASSEDSDNGKSLAEKLSAALSNICAKEDMVKKHAKVAEEAVSGWEKAEIEVSNLKQQLETTALKNCVLEDRITHLDGALKECVRQLRQAREEQEEKVHEVLLSKTRDWESEKLKLESRVAELESQLDFSQTEALISLNEDFQFKLEALGKENSDLGLKLFSLSEQLKIQTLERELSIQAAETASRQHLESIKKVTKLESECRRLHAMSRKAQQSNDQRPFSTSSYVESFTDSQSDSAEQMLALDNEPSCSDSWASALIAELDQFKSEKNVDKNTKASSMELDLMDDFLEMERLAALPEASATGPSSDHHSGSDQAAESSPSKAEFQHVTQRTAELEERIERMEHERAEMEISLADTQERLQISCDKLEESEIKLLELRRHLDSAYSSKKSSQVALLELQRQLDSDQAAENSRSKAEFEHVLQKTSGLEEKVERMESERAEFEIILAETQDKLEITCNQLKESERKLLELQSELDSAYSSKQSSEITLVELQRQLDSDRAAEHSQLRAEFHFVVAELEEKIKRTKNEKADLETLLADTQERLETSCNKMRESEIKLMVLQRKLDSAHSAKQSLEVTLEDTEKERKVMQTQLEVADSEVQQLRDEVKLLEEKLENDRVLAKDLALKYQQLEDELSKKKEAELWRAACSNEELKLKQERELAVAAEKLVECQQTIASLGKQLKTLATVDFELDAEKLENGESPIFNNGESRKSAPGDSRELSSGQFLVSSGKDSKEQWYRPSTSLPSSFIRISSSSQWQY